MMDLRTALRLFDSVEERRQFIAGLSLITFQSPSQIAEKCMVTTRIDRIDMASPHLLVAL